MANDVKALPVVAWIWRWADGEEEVVFVDATTIKFNPEFEDVPTQIASLVRQSDAESALAELRAEVERLSARVRDLLDQRQESAEKHSAYHDRLMNHIEQLMSRADTAEARLERARGLLREAADCADWDAAECAHEAMMSVAKRIAAFLGEGNG